MKFSIRHDGKGRIRAHLFIPEMTTRQADILQYYLEHDSSVLKAKVYEKTQDVSICFLERDRCSIIRSLQEFSFEDVHVPAHILESSGRELNGIYRDRLITTALWHFGKKLLP